MRNLILTIAATMLLFEILCEILTKAFFIPFGAAHPHPKEGWAAEMGIKIFLLESLPSNKSMFFLIFTHKFWWRALLMSENYFVKRKVVTKINHNLCIKYKPKTLDHVRKTIRVKHYTRSTEEAYVYWGKRFILFH